MYHRRCLLFLFSTCVDQHTRRIQRGKSARRKLELSPGITDQTCCMPLRFVHVYIMHDMTRMEPMICDRFLKKHTTQVWSTHSSKIGCNTSIVSDMMIFEPVRVFTCINNHAFHESLLLYYVVQRLGYCPYRKRSSSWVDHVRTAVTGIGETLSELHGTWKRLC